MIKRKKRLLIIIALVMLFIVGAKAQTVTPQGSPYGWIENLGGFVVDSDLRLPIRALNNWQYANPYFPPYGFVHVNPIDTLPYYQLGNGTWVKIITSNDSGSGGYVTLPQLEDTLNTGNRYIRIKDSNTIYVTPFQLYDSVKGRGIGTITALTGDVVASGTGTVTATIQPQAVTYSKIQNETGQTLLGRASGATGVVGEINIGSGLTLGVGGTLSATGSGGTVTSIATNNGLTGGTITSTGTIGIASVTGVSGSYGSSTAIPIFTVNAYGQVTAAATTTISPTGVQSLAATSPVNVSAGSGTVTVSLSSQTVTGTYGSASVIPSPTFNSVGLCTSIATYTITTPATYTNGRGITASGSNPTTVGLDTTQGYTFLMPETVSVGTQSATVTQGWIMLNPTSSNSVTTSMWSPAMVYSCQAWNTGSKVSQSISWAIVEAPTSGNPVSNSLNFYSSINGSAYANQFQITAGGQCTITNNLTVSGTTLLSGNVTSNGSITLNTAGNKLSVKTGSNASIGTATLSSGTVTVSTTAVTANSLIWVQYQSGGTLSGATLTRGIRVSTQSAGTSFVIVAETAPGTTNTVDNSPIQWWVIN